MRQIKEKEARRRLEQDSAHQRHLEQLAAAEAAGGEASAGVCVCV